ncbi:MAG: C-type lectin domain-containing protein [Bradymonadales bacterium]|nr:MAG: C-type lectin domain-containing protein [Bradymonadales bacterium]
MTIFVTACSLHFQGLVSGKMELSVEGPRMRSMKNLFQTSIWSFGLIFVGACGSVDKNEIGGASTFTQGRIQSFERKIPNNEQSPATYSEERDENNQQLIVSNFVHFAGKDALVTVALPVGYQCVPGSLSYELESESGVSLQLNSDSANCRASLRLQDHPTPQKVGDQYPALMSLGKLVATGSTRISGKTYETEIETSLYLRVQNRIPPVTTYEPKPVVPAEDLTEAIRRQPPVIVNLTQPNQSQNENALGVSKTLNAGAIPFETGGLAASTQALVLPQSIQGPLSQTISFESLRTVNGNRDAAAFQTSEGALAKLETLCQMEITMPFVVEGSEQESTHQIIFRDLANEDPETSDSDEIKSVSYLPADSCPFELAVNSAEDTMSINLKASPLRVNGKEFRDAEGKRRYALQGLPPISLPSGIAEFIFHVYYYRADSSLDEKGAYDEVVLKMPFTINVPTYNDLEIPKFKEIGRIGGWVYGYLDAHMSIWEADRKAKLLGGANFMEAYVAMPKDEETNELLGSSRPDNKNQNKFWLGLLSMWSHNDDSGILRQYKSPGQQGTSSFEYWIDHTSVTFNNWVNKKGNNPGGYPNNTSPLACASYQRRQDDKWQLANCNRQFKPFIQIKVGSGSVQNPGGVGSGGGNGQGSCLFGC